MKIRIVIALVALLFTTLSFAYEDNPYTKFDASKMSNETISVTWKRAADPMKACDAESKRVGNGGFKYLVQACSFWTKDSCVIITGNRTNLHTVGHEMRHCFQGDWHPQ